MREQLKSLPRHLPWVIGLSIVMAVIGPFGSYNYMKLPTRLLYFVITGGSFWLLIGLSAVWLGGQEFLDRWPGAARMALAGLMSALPGTAVIFLCHAWLVQPIPLRFAPQVLAESAFLAVAISIVVGLVLEWRLHADADIERARVAARSAAEPTPTAPDFFRRIPPALGRDLLALEMEDHYLRIHTAVGSDLILLRLRDAMAEPGPARGRQVHRSWWVAEGALASAVRDNGKNVLVLRNGLRVPVSKSFREQVKEAGWLVG